MKKKLTNTVIFVFTILLGLTIGFLICILVPVHNENFAILNVEKFDIKNHKNTTPSNYNNSGLVFVENEDPTIHISLRYATDDNFTGKKIYSYSSCWIQKNTMIKLKEANTEFKRLGYAIKIWDSYRPADVQIYLWSLVKDRRFIANPGKSGSRHNRGAAVDITLVDSNNNELVMPTGFDTFTEKAYRNAPMSDEAKKNLDLLTSVMKKHGFNTIETEWWHYDDSDADSYPILNIPFEELEKK